MEFPGSLNRWYVPYNPPIGSIYHLYTTYILPIGWLYITYHLLREPETAIDCRWPLLMRVDPRLLISSSLESIHHDMRRKIFETKNSKKSIRNIYVYMYVYIYIHVYIIDYDIVIFYVGCRFARYMRYFSFSLTVCNATFSNFQTVISSKKNMLAAHCRFYKVESYYLDWLLTYTFWEHPAPWLTLPGTNMAPENTPGPKRKLIFQSHWFPVLS